MHMPVNKPNVNCTYDSSHGTDEIYPKGPPHIYIYIHTRYIYKYNNNVYIYKFTLYIHYISYIYIVYILYINSIYSVSI